MTLHLNDRYVRNFVGEDEYSSMQASVTAAHAQLRNKTGAGSDFLGWTTLPEDYDKEEFARIKLAAEKIKKTCDVFIVIGSAAPISAHAP